MAELFNAMTISFAVVDVVFAILVLRGEGIKSNDNRWFALYCMAGAVWSFFFGELIVQTDEEIAYMCRCFGMAGVFLAFIFTTFLFCSWSQLPRPLLHGMRIFALLGIIVYPNDIRREDIIFHHTSFGMSYEFRTTFWTQVYVIYTVMMAGMFVILLGYMLRAGAKRRERHVAFWCFGALGGLMIGDVLDTILPILGYPAIPASTVTQFIATCVVFTAVNYANSSKLTISNTAGFLFHSVNVAVLIYDSEARLVQFSDAASRMLGIGPEAIGTKLGIDKIFECGYRPFEEGEDRRTIEAGVRGRDTECGIEISKLFDEYRDVIGYMVMVYDTTERRNFIQELQGARIRADEANKAKSSFLANMSHEIRTPINTVLGMNEMIRRESISPDVRGYSENIKVAGEALLSIINDILDFSKVEAGRIEIVEGEYEFGTMLGGLMNMFELKSKEKALDFVTDIDHSLPSVLHGDEVRVRQILMNLLSNAVKYTERGAVTFRITCKARTEEHIKIAFEVRDTGIGIKQEDMASLFDSFKRLDGKQTHHIEGTGLGLSIVKELVRLMGAELDVQSEYGEGSVFTFTITQGIVDAAPIGDPEKYALGLESANDEYHASFTAPEADVLAVDDNRMNLAVISGLLKKTRVRLDLAESGNECIDRVKHRKYDVILMDHMMPVMDGIETLRKIRELPDEQNLSKDAKVVALTANAIYGAKESYLASGFDAYLSKPVESDKLEALLKKLLPKELLHEGSDAPEEAEDEQTERIRTSLKASGISPEVGLSYCGTFEVYRATAESFCSMADEACVQLGHYRQQRAVGSYQIVIHGIKANARTLGCDDLFRIALRQEDECKEGGFEHITMDGNKPERMIRKLKKALETAFDIEPSVQDDGSDKLPITDDVYRDIIEEALAGLADFDDSGAVETLEKLNDYALDEDRRTAVGKALAKLKQYDYDEAGALLNGTINKGISE